MIRKMTLTLLFIGSLFTVGHAAEYTIDTQGAHASINFKVSHLGFSFVTGRFNKFEGTFNFDKNNIAASNINVTIDTKSVDTNHAERNKHIRSKKFLQVNKFPTATFVSQKIEDKGNNQFDISGNLTLHGVTKTIVIHATKIGEGNDPWGGYRAGFTGTTTIAMKDFNIATDFGDVTFELVVEGIRK